MNPIERVLRRVDRYQQRHSWLGFLFAVVKKFGDDKGGNLTALLAWNGFFALAPPRYSPAGAGRTRSCPQVPEAPAAVGACLVGVRRSSLA
jgi:hypothetical protein